MIENYTLFLVLCLGSVLLTVFILFLLVFTEENQKKFSPYYILKKSAYVSLFFTFVFLFAFVYSTLN